MLLNQSNKDFLSFTLKVIIAHTVTYFIFGLIMSNIFDYTSIWQQNVIKEFMRPMHSPWIIAGPLLQPVRGLLFAIGIWPVREKIFGKKYGWLILWNIIFIFGILSTPAAAPCSIEGLLYTQLPLWFHLIGLPEIMLQTMTFSLWLVWWMNRPQKEESVKLYSKNSKIFLSIILSIMIACFGYIGYAIGGILTAKMAGVAININGASISLKSQLMFVFAFIMNVLAVFFLIVKSYYSKYSLWVLFLIFWFIDVFSPLLYQFLINRMMPLHMAILMGLFPALIITISIKFNRTKFEQLDLIH